MFCGLFCVQIFFSLFLVPMSVIESSRENEQPVQQLIAWYEIRDMLLGQNCVQQDIKKALELAAACSHPDAVWLKNVFAGREDVTTGEEASAAFLDNEDSRALVLSRVCSGSDLHLLRRSAELGNAFAQAWLSSWCAGRVKFELAEKSATQGERDGYFWLGRCYERSLGCEGDLVKAKECYFMAATLGHVDSVVCHGCLLDKKDVQRYVWLGRGAAKRSSSIFLSEMAEIMRLFESNVGVDLKIVFAIGRALNGCVNVEKREIFGQRKAVDLVNDSLIAVLFYSDQVKKCRLAVDAWTMVGRRLKVVKDVRNIISKLIWEARDEANYHVDEKKKKKANDKRRKRK